MSAKPKLTGLGIALGAAVGTALGVGRGHMAIWLAVGVAVGMAIGSTLRRKESFVSGVQRNPSHARQYRTGIKKLEASS